MRGAYKTTRELDKAVSAGRGMVKQAMRSGNVPNVSKLSDFS